MNYIDPNITFNSGTYAFIAMGGLIAGTVRAPLTAILMVFELTRESSAILPLMIVVTISMILSSKLSRESVYTLKLIMNKIHIKSFGEGNLLRSIPVSEVYKRDFTVLTENSNFNEISYSLLSSNQNCISVKNRNGKYFGIISISTLKDTLLEGEHLKDVVIAGDIADKSIPKVTIHNNCYEVLELCRQYQIDGLPVLESSGSEIQVGMIWIKDINDFMQLEMYKIEHTTDLATKITNINKEHDITFMPGYVIAEIPVPNIFVGRTIGGLKVRGEYGVEIISIKCVTPKGVEIKALPKPDYMLKSTDSMIVAGETDKINILKSVS
jgi:CIC family chloride channel protein